MLAFAVAAAALTVTARREPAGRVVGTATAGLVAAIVDIFVL